MSTDTLLPSPSPSPSTSPAFAYARAESLGDALARLAATPGARLLAGGTELLPLARAGLLATPALVDVGRLPLAAIGVDDRMLVIGALATMAEVARAPQVLQHAPLLAQALLAGASTQVRHRASLAGNLMQAPRCPWFRSGSPGCNRRAPGSGCDALASGSTEGQRALAIFGATPACAAVAPSDLAVALLALDARIEIAGPGGSREVDVGTLYRGSGGDDPGALHGPALEPDELIVSIRVPLRARPASMRFVKVRERASFEFALVSVAAVLSIEAGVVREARVAAGGVGTVPWPLRAVEAALLGQPAGEASWRAAAKHAGDGAVPLPGNAFKCALLRNTVIRALESIEPAAEGAER